MRVLVVSPGFNEAGRFKLLESLGERVDLTLVTLERLTAPAFGEMPAPASTDRVTVLPNDAWRIAGRHLYRPHWGAWRRARPDVVHVEYDPWTPEFWSAMLPLLVLHPRAAWVICTRKNTRHVPGGLFGLVERLLTRLGVARTALVVTVSEMAAGVYRSLGYADRRIEVRHNVPIDERVFDGRDTRADDGLFRIGYVGSLLPHKGVETLARAVHELRGRVGDHVRLELVGRQHDSEYADRVTRHGWTTYHGLLPNHGLPDFLAGLDVFVMPSLVLPDHEEHDGVALLEAMAMARPAIGSRSGIIREIVRDEENGLLVDPGDVQALADRLHLLHDDPDLGQRLGKQAREDALERAGLDALTRGWLTAYESVA